MMAVQMIRCDIEDCTDFRPKPVNGLQLKAADLCNGHTVIGHPGNFPGIRISNISNHKDTFFPALHDFS